MTDEDEPLSPEEVRRVLERRAAMLAKPQREADPGDTFEVLVMRIGSERYGVDVRHIVEVRPLEALTPVPGVPPIWAGIVNLRGVLHPVLHTPRYLGVEGGPADTGHVVVMSAGDLVVALLADEVAGLQRIPLQDVDAPIGADAAAHRKAVSGVTPDLLLLLDVETLLQDPALVVDEKAS